MPKKPLTLMQRRAFIIAALLWIEPCHAFKIMKDIDGKQDKLLAAQFGDFFKSRRSYYEPINMMVDRDLVAQKIHLKQTHNAAVYVNHLTDKGQGWFFDVLFDRLGDKHIDISNTDDLLNTVANLMAKEELREMEWKPADVSEKQVAVEQQHSDDEELLKLKKFM